MELESATGGYVSDVTPRSATCEDKSQHQLMPEHYQTSAFVEQKQGGLANNKMGFNPCSGDNEVSSHVSNPASDYPSDVLTSNTTVGAANASTKVDEDHPERAVEPNVSNPPLDYPSDVLTSHTPVGTVNASTEVDEDHSERAVEPNEMGLNPCSGDNEASSHVSHSPSDYPSDVLTSNTPVGAVNASTEVDEDHSEQAVEPNGSNTPSKAVEPNEMGFNPCSGDNEASSLVSHPPSDYPSLTSNTPVGALNASTEVDEDNSEGAVEPNGSNTPSTSKETPMQMEQRQMSEPNGELRTLSECHDGTDGKNLETPLPPATTSESFDSSPLSMDKNNDSSRSMKMQDEYQVASSDDDSPTSTDHEHSSDGLRHHSSQSGELFRNFGSETLYPPTQVMERPADTASPSYRIPAHVFATEPTAGAEWSVASNESLFSIHIGNMSFSKDMYWLGKYDELDKPDETSMPNSQTNMSGDVSNNQLSPHVANQISLSQPTLDDESRAEETMREVIMENIENLKEGTRRPMLPHHSKGSTKSFAFPVLTDVQRIGSSIIFQGKQKTELESRPQTHEETSKEAQQLKETSNEPKQPKSATTATSNGCFSCFSCCALGQGQSS